MSTRCAHCRKTLRLQPEDAGRMVYCQACGGKTLVQPLPGQPHAAAHHDKSHTHDESPTPAKPDADATAAPAPAQDAKKQPASGKSDHAEPTAPAPVHMGLVFGTVAVVAMLLIGLGMALVLRSPVDGKAMRDGTDLPSIATTVEEPGQMQFESPAEPSTAGASPSLNGSAATTAPTADDAVIQASASTPETLTESIEAMNSPAAEPISPAGQADEPVAVSRDDAEQSDEPAIVRPAPFRRPPVRRTAPRVVGVSDEQIEEAIRRGVDYLLAGFDENGRLVGRSTGGVGEGYHSGLNALWVYALLQCEQAIKDERLHVHGPLMRQMLDTLKQLPMDEGMVTYSRAIRAMALAMHARKEDVAALRADVAWLLQAHRNGAYTYAMQPRRSRRWDNSNSQYGLLGVWSGAEAGVEIPNNYWTAVETHWTETQLPDGQWGYTEGAGNGYLSMTAAGLASLFVTHDYIHAPRMGKSVGRPPFSPALEAGLAWFETGSNSVRLPSQHWGYVLYGIERVGLASGFKYFGEHDWYRELAAQAVRRQRPDGSFGNAADTPFALLFLARGRHPILMNKLRFDGYWANRPRDLANLARYASYQLERPLNWQVVSIDRDWSDWLDAPIVYLASHEAVRLTDEQCARLAAYAQAGGMIYTQSDGNSQEFTTFITALGKRLFPDYEWKEVPPDHELFSVHFKLEQKPRLRMITNGARILMLHSPEDLAQHWQMRAERTQRASFEFGVNLFLYAAGKTDLRNRLVSPYLPPPAAPPTLRVPVAQLKYAGNWNPEPHALTRFTRYMAYDTGLGVEVIPTAMRDLRLKPEGQRPATQQSPTSEPVLDQVRLALLTGTNAIAPSAEEAEALRRYVEEGGVVLIDAAGGSVDFYQSVISRLLPMAFGPVNPQIMHRNHPVLNAIAPGMEDLTRPRFRHYAHTKVLGPTLEFEILEHGRGAVIITPLDLTTGLLGTHSWGINGYHPEYAQAVVKNVLLWAVDSISRDEE